MSETVIGLFPDNHEAQEHCSRGDLQSHTEVAAAVEELQLSVGS